MASQVFRPIEKKIGETITVRTNKKIQLRDTGVYIQSNADGKIIISADGSGADDITLDGTVTASGGITVDGGIVSPITVDSTNGATITYGGVHMLTPNSGTLDLQIGNPASAGIEMTIIQGTVGTTNNVLLLPTMLESLVGTLTFNQKGNSVQLMSTSTTRADIISDTYVGTS